MYYIFYIQLYQHVHSEHMWIIGLGFKVEGWDLCVMAELGIKYRYPGPLKHPEAAPGRKLSAAIPARIPQNKLLHTHFTGRLQCVNLCLRGLHEMACMLQEPVL